MADEARIMLTLAALTYRGFQEVRPGEPHDAAVREALVDGLQTLEPVRNEWDLVWGPVTTRMTLALFDSSAMYVVRNRREPHRYVVAIRGTNPVASSDWLFGDLWVGTTVRWPWPDDGTAAISTSTALGLVALLDMRWPSASIVSRLADLPGLSTLREAFAARAGRAALADLTHASAIEPLASAVFDDWIGGRLHLNAFRASVQNAVAAQHVKPSDLRRKWLPRDRRDGGIDLLTFLKTEADRSRDGLEVTVTGHSKGGALAPAMALWLTETQRAPDPAERWDERGQSRVLCHAFAGPTPGNAEFAARIDAQLGERHRHLRNLNDLVTHAWQVDEMREIPALYGDRTKRLEPLLLDVVASVEALNYRHATTGVTTFRGELNDRLLLPVEGIHQHLDAYLVHVGLGPAMNATTFFLSSR